MRSAVFTARIAVERQGALHLRVEDDGPDCPEEQLAHLTARGMRADESVPGAGLRLAISADIVESYGADLRLSHSRELGGFLADVRFPAQ